MVLERTESASNKFSMALSTSASGASWPGAFQPFGMMGLRRDERDNELCLNLRFRDIVTFQHVGKCFLKFKPYAI